VRGVPAREIDGPAAAKRPPDEEEAEPGRPAADDRAVARIDAMRPSTVELNGILLSAEVMTR